jgi:hypothetical protein
MRISSLSNLKRSNFIALMGQSNANGYQFPADANTYLPRSGQFIFNNVTQSWERLQQNYNNGGSYHIYTGSVGCEMKLMELLYAYYGTDQYLFKYGEGGTSIDPTPAPGTYNWSPFSVDDPYMFRGCVNSFNDSVASFPAQMPEIKVLIWIQGESDMLPEQANAYETNFRNFINALKNDWNLPGLKVLQTLLADTQTALGGPNKAIINTAKINYSINGNKYVNIDGAEVADGGAHFTSVGQNYIAQKVFDTLITML